MNTKNVIKGILNSALSVAGLAVVNKETVNRSNRSQIVDSELTRFLSEIEETLRTTNLPALPKYEGRHHFMRQAINLKVQTFYILNYLHQSLATEGDVCEFGVAHGATTVLLANEIKKTNRHLWLFDSFEGLPKPTVKDKLIDDIANLGSIEKYQGQMSHPKEQVLSRLHEVGFPESRLHIIPGFIEETIKSCNLPEKVAFAYVDFDFYEPILIALQSLDSRISRNGFVLVDDYGYFSEGAKTAVDEFMAAQGNRYELNLPPASAGKFAILKKVV